MNRLLLIVCAVLAGCVVVHADKSRCEKGACFKVMGKSGKITMWLEGQEKEKAMTILFDAIFERDKDGKKAGFEGLPKAEKHGSENFASLGFQFSANYETKIANLSAVCFNFSSTLSGPKATLTVPTCIFKENGTVSLCDGEEVEVRAGMVKFNIELKDWKFCGDEGMKCKNGEVGAGVDFMMQISTPEGKKAKERKREKKQKGKKRKARKFAFGSNATTTLDAPESVDKDNMCAVMPEEYPKLENKGGKFIMTLRFPKFSDRIVYDPAINLAADPVEEGSVVEPVAPTTKAPNSTKDNASAPIAASMLFVALVASLCWFL